MIVTQESGERRCEPGWIRGGAGRRKGTGDAGARITVRGFSDLFRPSVALGQKKKENGGEIADLKVSDLESLNRKFLQKFSMNALGTLHFPFFLS